MPLFDFMSQTKFYTIAIFEQIKYIEILGINMRCLSRCAVLLLLLGTVNTEILKDFKQDEINTKVRQETPIALYLCEILHISSNP